ncbi:MAG TPA: SH3 domain-containing protein [Candidatus Pullichristensenella excrementigallinarum]|uniref:SH3 domain-containing protein n=1 Tax=Candidatus Pullichristensenella excrementigallinarum TaxID=2840907 RepID=A0A9D1LDB9_9FIRM|nr:SH3 domain-containing protein [Candidatus Pullichristensenella excrementigallinarum]
MRIERSGLIRRLIPILLVTALVLMSLPTVAFAASLSAIVTSDSMAVYSDMYLTKKIATLSKGDVVVVTAAKSGVCAITYRPTGKSGFCKASSLAEVTAYSQKVVVAVSGAKAYEKPNTSSASVSLKKGWTLNYFGSDNGWAIVEADGYLAYTPEKNLALPGQNTATATPVPEKATEGNFYAQVTKATYAYSDSVGSKRIGTLPKGTQVYVHEYTSVWALVSVDGAYGYCDVSVLAPVTSTATATPMPSKDNAADSSEEATEGNFYARVTKSMYAYSDSVGSKRIGILSKGTRVYVHQYTDVWALVSIDGAYGYCEVSKLEREEEATKGDFYAQVTKATYAYSDSVGSKRIGVLSKGTQVYVHEYTSVWALVSIDGAYGYCDVTVLERSTDPTATATPQIPSATIPIPSDGEAVTATFTALTNQNTVVYKKPSTSGSKMGTLPAGTEVTVLLYNESWAYISIAGYYGFCFRQNLAPTEGISGQPTPTPTPSATEETPVDANFSAQATEDIYTYGDPTGNNKIGVLSKGTVVTVHQYTSTWALVSLDGNYGFCDVTKLQRVEVEPSPTVSVSPEDCIPATVTAKDGLDVYTGTSTSTIKKYTLPYGTQVNVVQANSTWAMIELNGNYGFCLVAGLTLNSELKPGVVQGYATVIYPSAPVYASESTGAVSTTIPQGTEVAVYAVNSKWAYVGKGDARGYMLVEHLSSESYPELSSGDSGSSVLALQKILEAYGYFDGEPAGNYSSLTETAVRRFQAAVSGLQETGKADIHTIRVLMSGNAPASPLLSLNLSSGSTGTNVQRLQTRLYYKGYLSKSSSVDGEYGSITTSAVKLFQAAAGLSATGTADSKTLQALYSNSAPKNTGTAADASGSSSGAGDVGSDMDELPPNPTNSEKIEYVIYVAQQQLGKPYVFGATGTSSFDCSGYTRYCYGKVGVSLAHSAQNQGYNAGKKVEGVSNLKRGDIVCLNTISDNDLSDHVGIYLGSGKFIHASSGAGKVVISEIGSGYYNRVFSWGRRVL